MGAAKPDQDRPVIVWFRRDLRLADNPALCAAVQTGAPVIPLYVLDTSDGVRPLGAASRWWLDKSLRALSAEIDQRGSRLILRRGDAATIVTELAQQTGAGAIHWNRLYDEGAVRRDTSLKTGLEAKGLTVQSHNAALIVEPWTLKTKAGGPFKVFTPFWKTLRSSLEEFTLARAPDRLGAPKAWPHGETIGDWRLHPSKPDWSAGFEHWTPGEAGANRRLHEFIDHDLTSYPRARDEPASEGSSHLSAHLHWGEIGPRQVWRAIEAAAHHDPALHAAADKFQSELAWRDFNHSILFEHPRLETRNYKPAFDGFPWLNDGDGLEAWKRGQTGYPMVDAGMRQLWTTGFMHNRVRMIAASFLIKHLLIDWREGERWFWDTLVDADEANNPANWQWVAGSGADASPFFRIFSPMGQGERFDPRGDYVRRWVPELAGLPAEYIHAPWTAPDAVLARAGVRLGESYPKPIVEHRFARERALAALKTVAN